MNRNVAIALSIAALALLVGTHGLDAAVGAAPTGAPAQEAHKMPDVVVLAKENKLGPVTFSHTNHTTKNYNLAGTGPVACVECHHTAQPASEAAKHPPDKTAWPADRTTMLSADSFAKDPSAVGPIACRQ